MQKADSANRDALLKYLIERREAVAKYIQGFGLTHLVAEPHLRDFLLSYPLRGGKSLRPAFVALSASAAAGKDETESTLPLQAAVELYHNWTLIHDDIIDEDDFRRGKPSLHREIEAAVGKDGRPGADKYGRDIAILVGDLMHSFVTLVLMRMAENGVALKTVLSVLRLMHAELTPSLVDGEARDVRFCREAVGKINESQILEMLEGKTAALFEFCGTSGAMVGLDTPDAAHPVAKALSGFSRMTGLAFQIQDDILGLVGDQDKLGKPRGSDLREGKHTLVLMYAFRNGTQAQLDALRPLIGKKDISPAEVDRAEAIIRETGAVDHVGSVAREYVENALPLLEELEPSAARDLLAGLAGFMIEREF
jgi:geranylgeranyl diphosphate synthase type I